MLKFVILDSFTACGFKEGVGEGEEHSRVFLSHAILLVKMPKNSGSRIVI
jgi:hypothetical protein